SDEKLKQQQAQALPRLFCVEFSAERIVERSGELQNDARGGTELERRAEAVPREGGVALRAYGDVLLVATRRSVRVFSLSSRLAALEEPTELFRTPQSRYAPELSVTPHELRLFDGEMLVQALFQ